jgi:hypothetical protein
MSITPKIISFLRKILNKSRYTLFDEVSGITGKGEEWGVLLVRISQWKMARRHLHHVYDECQCQASCTVS